MGGPWEQEAGDDYVALRDQPYLPLYVQDFLTDEKLTECSAESTGVYIRLMCLMHKSEDYGTILLKQKDKQTGKQVSDFAIKLVRQMPYDADTIERSLAELLEEEVIGISGDVLFQKRMVKDGKLSDIRASAGKKGGRKKAESDFANRFANGFAKAKSVANTESEIESEYEDEIITESEGDVEKRDTSPRAGASVYAARFDEFWAAYPKRVGKGAAQKSWAKIKPSAALHKKILAAIADGKESEEWSREGGRFIPNPSTWLNQSRWEDELTKKGDSTHGTDERGRHTRPGGPGSNQPGAFNPDGFAGFKNALDRYDDLPDETE